MAGFRELFLRLNDCRGGWSQAKSPDLAWLGLDAQDRTPAA
jgi:hypothetical protein